jgi:ATP-dependent DNA helicase RecG
MPILNWLGNVDDAIVFLKKHLRMSYKIETLQRENILELPEDALREAVVNAVCHRDYFEKGARVMVEIYDDRVDIVSPGGVCKGITHENFGTVSIARNSVLASMLHRIGYIEQMGTGIMRMKNAAKAAKVSAPEFELSGFFKVTFKRIVSDVSIGRPSFASDTQAIPSDTKRYPSDTQAMLNDRKSAIITYLETYEKVAAPDIARLFGVTNVWARKVLRQMANEGTVKKIGDNRYAYYVLNGKLSKTVQ